MRKVLGGPKMSYVNFNRTKVIKSLNDKKTNNNESDNDPVNKDDKILCRQKSAKRKIFPEELLCSSGGLQEIYNTFPQKCKFRGRGHETADLKNLISKYKEWAFLLTPGTAFPDVLLSCERFGPKKLTFETLQAMREAERDRYIADVDAGNVQTTNFFYSLLFIL
jgi:hypothetical protein